MRILTLNDDNFALHCKMLEARVLSDCYEPDMIVAVGTEGNRVAAKMFENTPHYTMLPRDPHHSEYPDWAIRMVQHTPRGFNNVLRYADSLLQTFKNHGLYHIDVPDALEDHKQLLVVCDVVDSGATLASVMAALGDRCRAAAISITSVRTPIIRPHYYIYNDHTLIRFPWSVD